jgi:DNA-binding response OmpR family regulator
MQPDAVVLDTTSKELDWAALSRWLRKSADGRSAAILTVGRPEDGKAARAAGAHLHLAGSAVPRRLAAELEALFRENSATRK